MQSRPARPSVSSTPHDGVRHDAAAAGQRRAPGTLDVRGVAWYNPPQKSLIGMVPGLMALVLVMPALALSLALTREKELGSFEGLAATPIADWNTAGQNDHVYGFCLLSVLP